MNTTLFNQTPGNTTAIFKNWAANVLPSKGHFITSLGFCIRDANNRLMLVQVAHNSKPLTAAEKIPLQIVHANMRRGNKQPTKTRIAGNTQAVTPQFLGTYFIQFENSNFKDGRVWINGNITDEKGVKTLLDFSVFDAKKK